MITFPSSRRVSGSPIDTISLGRRSARSNAPMTDELPAAGMGGLRVVIVTAESSTALTSRSVVATHSHGFGLEPGFDVNLAAQRHECPTGQQGSLHGGLSLI